MQKSFINTLLEKTVETMSKELDIPYTELIKACDLSKNTERCDFTLYLSKLLAENSEKVKKFNAEHKKISEITLDLCGQVAFISISRESHLASAIKTILSQNIAVGQLDLDINKGTVLVEYSSPNIAKEFHAGHLRTTLLGSFVTKLYKKRGYNTISINYLGDYGKQFGMVLEGFNRYPELVTDDVIKSAFDVYVKVSAEAEKDESLHEKAKKNFYELENKNPEVLKMWKNLREESIKKYKSLYERINVEFDIYSGESFYYEKCKEIILNINNTNNINKNNIKEELDNIKLTNDNSNNNSNNINNKCNAKIVDLSEFKLGKLVLSRTDGTTLYSTRDIAAALERLKTVNLHKSIYVVAEQQNFYFEQIFHCLKKLYDVDIKKLEHISYGMVAGMSTRKGNVVFLQDILNNAKSVMMEVMKKDEEKFKKIKFPQQTAEEMAISALIVQDFSARRTKGYEFSMDKFMAIEGETGPYLQYTHCRLCSIKERNSELLKFNQQSSKQQNVESLENLQKAEILKKLEIQGEKTTKPEFLLKADSNVLKNFESINTDCIKDNKEVQNTIFYLLRYENVLEETLKFQEPSKLVSFLMKLAKYSNRLFAVLKVANLEDESVALARLAVFECIRYVLASGMEILGMTPLNRV